MRLFGLLQSLFTLSSTSLHETTTSSTTSLHATTTMPSRTIGQVVPAATSTGGPIRLIGTTDIDGGGTLHALAEVDPFILLDTGLIPKHHMPKFGPHPHRGHSVVTILLQGQVESWDSFQSADAERLVLTAPASYWVDAGSGVFHDERSIIPDESDEKQHMHIFQLWVGVKEEDRKNPPRVQHQSDLPRLELKDPEGKVVVGTGIYHVGDKTKIETPHPVEVVHIKQHKGTTYQHPIPPSHGGFVVPMKGKPSFGGTAPSNDSNDVLVLNNNNGDYLEVITAEDEDAEYLLCTGEKIEEKWYKKLVASGAVIAATEEEARGFVESVEKMSKSGKEEGGSFAPFGAESKKRKAVDAEPSKA